MDRLKSQELIYPCTCSRSDVEAAASAPHAGQEGPVYPGTCSGRTASDAALLGERPYCWRFRFQGRDTFRDRLAGHQQQELGRMGDFVIARGDGTPSYQLAVVVDDHAMGVTEVVRGADLLPSTFRQRAIAAALGFATPGYAHVPLVVGPDGRRLAKRHGDTRLSVLRERGESADRLIGALAFRSGLTESERPCRPKELIDRFDWDRIPTQPLVWTPDDWAKLLS